MPTLASTAYYYPQNDTVEVVVYAIDDSGQPIAPQDIQEVQVSLMKGEVVLQASGILDKFYANEDFAFRVFFAHPSSTSMLEVEASVLTRDNTSIRKRINVLKGDVQPVENDFGDNAVNTMDE